MNIPQVDCLGAKRTYLTRFVALCVGEDRFSIGDLAWIRNLVGVFFK
jgi:hypothetical protein